MSNILIGDLNNSAIFSELCKAKILGKISPKINTTIDTIITSNNITNSSSQVGINLPAQTWVITAASDANAILTNVLPVKIVTNNFSGSFIISFTLFEKLPLCLRKLKYAVSEEEKKADSNNNIINDIDVEINII